MASTQASCGVIRNSLHRTLDHVPPRSLGVSELPLGPWMVARLRSRSIASGGGYASALPGKLAPIVGSPFNTSGREEETMAVGLGPRVSRREFVAAGLAAAAGATLPAFGQSRNLSALTLREASELLRRKDVSPVDLTQACLDRIERHDRAINAFITVMREQALAAAREMESRAQTRDAPWTAPRDSDRAQGQHRHRRNPDDGRQRRLQGSGSRRGRRRRRPAEEGRRRRSGQTESSRIRARRNVSRHLLRAGAQSVGARSGVRRVIRRFCRRCRGRHVLRHARHRHRRVHPHSRVVVRHCRIQADVRTRQHSRRGPHGLDAGPRRPDVQDRRGCGVDAVGDRRLRRARSDVGGCSRSGLQPRHPRAGVEAAGWRRAHAVFRQPRP